METNSIEYTGSDKNQWYIALKSYRKCVETYVRNNNSITELEDSLNDPNIDRICVRELNKLREIGPSIGYKEIHGLNDDDTELRNPSRNNN